MSQNDPYAAYQKPLDDPYAAYQKPAKPSLSAELIAAKKLQREKYPTQLEKETSGGVEGAGPIETFSRNVASGFGIDPDSPISGTYKNLKAGLGGLVSSYQQGANAAPIHGTFARIPFGLGKLATDMGKGFVKGSMEHGADIGEGIRSGDVNQVAKGAGGAVGEIGSLVLGRKAPEAVESGVNTAREAAGSTAERLYESALKPGPRSNSLSEVRSMVKTGLREGIPVNERGMGKLKSISDDLNAKVASEIASGGKPINKFKVASRLSDPAKKFAAQVNPESDLAAISETGNEFLRNAPADIPPSLAQELKQGTYQQLNKRAYGELKGAQVEGQKAIARGLKEELEAQFPNVKGLNQRNSNLFGLKPELEAAINRSANHDIFGIGTPLVTGAVGAITGSLPEAVGAGLVKAMIHRPGIKSRLAIALSKLGPTP